MAYSVSADMDIVFGADNIASWTDLDKDKDADKIAARKELAILASDAEIDDAARTTGYRIPIAGDTGSTPTSIRMLSIVGAQLWLYEARGAIDTDDQGAPKHNYRFFWYWRQRRLEAIRSGEIKLDAMV